MSALDLPLREQATQIASGELDSGELLDACLARIEERNPDLNAVIATFPDRSREMLEKAPDGPLRGVPVLIKDEWPLPWRAETVGAASVPGVTLEPGDSGPYRALRDAGAVIAGIANMHELGSSSTGNTSLYGAAHNPWDLERCPGGSSSGPAAAVSGGLVSGALCRDAADARLLASALFGEDLPAGQPSGLRIGVMRDPFWTDSAPGVREACETALESLRAEIDGEVVEVELPDLDLILPAALLVAQAEEAAHLVPEVLNGLSPELGLVNRGVLKLRALLPLILTARAFRVRAKVRRDLAALFDGIDLLAWPAVPAVAPSLAEPMIELPSGVESADAGNARQGVLANLTGVPGVSVPVGLDDGMPAALQLLGAWGSDALLLDAAEALERATDREFVDLRPSDRKTAPLRSGGQSP